LQLTSLADEAPEPEEFESAPETVEEEEELQAGAADSSHDLVFLTPADEEPSPVADIAPLDLEPLVESLPVGSDTSASDAAVSDTIDPMPALDFAAPPELEESWNGSSEEEFIDLGEWLEQNRTPSSTRMIAHDEEPENNEQKDFAEMLDKFKHGISRNVDEEDFESHYDLGIAFREMGLLDEAIGSFQKAARGPDQLVRASEAIGQCFMDKGEAGVTITVLERVIRTPGMSDAQLVGVLYLLGRAQESLSREGEAAAYYQRVLAVQIGFRDAATRLSSLAQASR
jgi:tetratricopeptide (TPR) repeat protein